MERIFKPKPAELDAFTKGSGPFPTKYGLPQQVKFCRSCVISNQRPNSAQEFTTKKDTSKATINFDADGVCDACRFVQKKKQIDWSIREKELVDLCNRYRRDDGQYDCLVPGSGGKDSIYTAHLLKYKYGMNPLTMTWAPHIYTDWGWKNMQGWIHSGFDNHLVTPNGRVHRLLTRLALELLGHPFQPFILGQKYLPPILAAKFDIPLVFYGENEAEYGNPIAENVSAKRDWSYFAFGEKDKVFLSGVSLADLKSDFGLKEVDLHPYLPADPALLEKKKIEIHYFGYYTKWHPQTCYYYASENASFQASPERTPGTYSKYASIDDKMDDFHFYTTGIKFGIGHASYDASQEIRSGDITREEGVALVKKFDIEFPERFASELFQYLSISERDFPLASKMFEQGKLDREYFDLLMDRFRSPHLWKYADGKFNLRHTVY